MPLPPISYLIFEDIEIDEHVLKSRNLALDVIPANLEQLLKYCTAILDSVLTSVEFCPPSFRYLCYMLKFYVTQKWPDGGEEPWQKAIAGFFFLRFVCPAIVAPEKHSLLPGSGNVDAVVRLFPLLSIPKLTL